MLFAISAHLLFGALVQEVVDSRTIEDVSGAIGTAFTSVALVLAGRGGIQVRSRIRDLVGLTGMVWIAIVGSMAILALLHVALASAFAAFLQARKEEKRREEMAPPSLWMWSKTLARTFLT